MPKTNTKRSGGKKQYAGPYDGSKTPWNTRTMTTKGAKRTFMVPSTSKPTEAWKAISESLGQRAYKRRGK